MARLSKVKSAAIYMYFAEAYGSLLCSNDILWERNVDIYVYVMLDNDIL